VGEVDENGKIGFLAGTADVQGFADAVQVFADDSTRDRDRLCYRLTIEGAVIETLILYETVWKT
jgi:hypothetical protein